MSSFFLFLMLSPVRLEMGKKIMIKIKQKDDKLALHLELPRLSPFTTFYIIILE